MKKMVKYKVELCLPEKLEIGDCKHCPWCNYDYRCRLVYCLLLRANIDIDINISILCPLKEVEYDNI